MANWTPTTIPVTIGATTYQLRGIISDDPTPQLVLATAVVGTDGIPVAASDLGNGQAMKVQNMAQSLAIGLRAIGDPVTDDKPVYMGMRATSSLVNSVPPVDDEMQALRGTVDGKLITLPFCNPEDEISQEPVVLNNTTADLLLQAAQGVGVKTYFTGALICNASATDTRVLFKDVGSGRIYPIPAPRLAAGGGGSMRFLMPLKGSPNSVWNVAATDAVVHVTVVPFGYKTKI